MTFRFFVFKSFIFGSERLLQPGRNIESDFIVSIVTIVNKNEK